MKKLFILFILSVFMTGALKSFSQDSTKVQPLAMDTIVTKKNVKIPGKITKITETEIEYKKTAASDAPVYVVSKDKIREIRWANGTRETISADELSVNKEQEIIEKRSALKFHFFSLMNDQITFSYEHTLKVGTNLELSVGLINNSMIEKTVNQKTHLTQGGIFKAGVKFLLGQDYYVSGMKYTHPLKGRFLKPEIAFSSFTTRGLQRYKYTNSTYPYGSSTLITSDQKVTSAAVIINYGRQYILGNIITFSYSVGAGYSFADVKYNNPNFAAASGYQDAYNVPTNMYTHLRGRNLPLAFTASVTLGYIFK